MAEVTGYTSTRMKQIEDETVVGGSIVGDDLILETREGTPINAGDVRGPQGDKGDTGEVTQAEMDAVTARVTAAEDQNAAEEYKRQVLEAANFHWTRAGFSTAGLSAGNYVRYSFGAPTTGVFEQVIESGLSNYYYRGEEEIWVTMQGGMYWSSNASGIRRLTLIRNDSPMAESFLAISAAGAVGQNVSASFRLAPDDFVALQHMHSANASLQVSSDTRTFMSLVATSLYEPQPPLP